MSNMHDVIIVGSGPAGYAAAIYTSRAMLRTLLLSGAQPGGQPAMTTIVENFPGFPEGIQGPVLVEQMRKQAEKFGTEIKISKVSKVSKVSKDKSFLVSTGEGELKTRSIIVATGSAPRKLGISGEEKFSGKGISYCATCDGFFFKGKEVAVIGGGDTALEEAMFLTRVAKKVTVIHRREGFRATPIILERAKQDPKITFLTKRIVEEVYGDTAVKGIRLWSTQGDKGGRGELKDLPVDGVFVAIGHEPNTGFLKGFVELDENGYVKITYNPSASLRAGLQLITNNLNEAQTATSVPGVFAAGDCADPRYRQVVVAAGMGCMAAVDVQKYLNTNKF